MSAEFSYQGTELQLFSAANNWKAYWSQMISPFVGARVLEVGAGSGATIGQLHHSGIKEWLALEPDASLAEGMRRDQSAGKLPANVDVRVGTVATLPSQSQFDTILYIDVLEHIADDRQEIEQACKRLSAKGNLIVLAPAHQWLFSPFDAAIGHFRRYDRKSLHALATDELSLRSSIYLDSVGLLLSAGNAFVLKSTSPTPGHIALWDKMLVPISRVIDPALMHALGKSVLVVWQKKS